MPEVSYTRREWMTFARDAHICVIKIARRDRYERMYRIYQKSYFLSVADFHRVSFHEVLLSQSFNLRRLNQRYLILQIKKLMTTSNNDGQRVSLTLSKS